MTETRAETSYRMADGDSYFVAICTSPDYGGGATFDFVLKGVDPAPLTESEVVVAGERFRLRHGAGGVGVTTASTAPPPSRRCGRRCANRASRRWR